MNKDINQIRNEIDLIDKEIRELFVKRMNLSKSVAKYKLENNISVEDVNREIEVISKNSCEVSDELKKYYIDFLKKIITLSKDYQKVIIERK